jgi:DNA-binding MarR family transcriptional regulator
VVRRLTPKATQPVTGRAAARLAKHVEIALDHVGLSLPQYRVLIILEKGSTAASALASNLVVSPPSVTALVDGLVTRGFVERVSVAGDRRRVEHVLTDKGCKALAEADAAVNGRLEEIAGYLPAGERSKVVTGLQLWLKAMDAYIESRVREKLASSR